MNKKVLQLITILTFLISSLLANNIGYNSSNQLYTNTSKTQATLGHELTHDMDKQDSIFKPNDPDQNRYATNFGENLSEFTNEALYMVNGSSLATTNNHFDGIVTSSLSVFNQSNTLLNNNNSEFASLDKSGGGDNRQLNTQEIQWLQNDENIKLFALQNNISLNDARARLAQMALNDMDKGFSYALNNLQDDAAKAYLQQ